MLDPFNGIVEDRKMPMLSWKFDRETISTEFQKVEVTCDGHKHQVVSCPDLKKDMCLRTAMLSTRIGLEIPDKVAEVQ
jgi:hypothetical protein